ncbi:TPA: hypothetical protein DCZ46_04090 [Candidatus Campbellbacteria bacterium]|nr:MAG: GCN5-related N-acetyltransferase (GNAT)-like protein [Candidatus Campbellbacteria bacterium GW2011_OD1_34_28]KKP75015.1 MAG: hypothetical protein UR74_C0002G0281 [Candidatus Campbellbacteria bacterium GW2011_GWD2_35_24]KKP75901.1 MAG: hypothetical protein UR75_C0002G0282 [Candidatus Campbellbacteria bacterium GW2011_GWC2_35_28]KKP76851.1 MAG: hypothetical protein UR76_C0002G0052 [Candidatus Campbellbacteria bacterium GW2011_GWC1_35_31]KKP78777.1 MAG: hypothetical protein UR79_C0002G0052
MITNSPSEKIIKQAREIAESIFKSAEDPNQMPINEESRKKLKKLSDDSLLYKIDEKENLISWVVTIPTSTEIMDKFLAKEINEKELFEQTKPNTEYDALYLCAIVTAPEYRNKGYAKEMTLEAISRFEKTKDLKVFAWPTSKEGLNLARNLEKETGRKIYLRID